MVNLKFFDLQYTMSGPQIKREETMRPLGILTASLLIGYLIVFSILGYVQNDFLSIIIIFSPLLLHMALLAGIYKKTNTSFLFFIVCIQCGLLLAVSIYDPLINYSGMLLVYVPFVFLLGNSKMKHVAGMSYLATVFIIIVLRYFTAHEKYGDPFYFKFQYIMLPLFCLIAVGILATINSRFNIYKRELRLQKALLEKKNASLESLVSISEQQKDKLKRMGLLKERLISLVSHNSGVSVNSFKSLIDSYEKGNVDEKISDNNKFWMKNSLLQTNNIPLDSGTQLQDNEVLEREQLFSCSEFSSTIESILEIYATRIVNKNLHVILSNDMPDSMCMTITRDHIEIILRNLVSNAINFSLPENKILIGIETKPDNSLLLATITIQDFGCGIQPALLEKLKQDEKIFSIGIINAGIIGSGLGIVMDIIRDQNLQYNIQSKSGKGTSFSVSIPLVTCQS